MLLHSFATRTRATAFPQILRSEAAPHAPANGSGIDFSCGRSAAAWAGIDSRAMDSWRDGRFGTDTKVEFVGGGPV